MRHDAVGDHARVRAAGADDAAHQLVPSNDVCLGKGHAREHEDDQGASSRVESCAARRCDDVFSHIFTRTLLSILSQGDLYKGGTDSLDLTSMLEDVPADMKGDEGLDKDQAGKARIAERSEKPMTAAEKQAAKKAAFAAKQKADAEKPLFPELPKLPF